MRLVIKPTASNVRCRRLALMFAFLCLLSLSVITANAVHAAQPCVNSWSIILQGLKPTYGRGEAINGSATFSISNHPNSPLTNQQILVGIIDGNRHKYDVACVYHEQAPVCPQEYKDTVNFTLHCPSNPGTYQILATNHQQYSCEDAQRLFPEQSASEIIWSTIQVSDTIVPNPVNPQNSGSSTTTSPPTTPPVPPVGQMPNITAWYQQNQQTIFTILALITIVIVGVLYMVRKERTYMDKVVLVSIGGLAAVYLLVIYVAIPIIGYIIIHWLAILISVVALIAVFMIAVMRGWITLGSRRVSVITEEPTTAISSSEDTKGYVYIMRCPTHKKNTYKIGYCTCPPEERANQIDGTGVPEKYDVLQDWRVKDYRGAESLIHKALENYRVNPKREFFEAPISGITKIIEKTIADMRDTDIRI